MFLVQSSFSDKESELTGANFNNRVKSTAAESSQSSLQQILPQHNIVQAAQRSHLQALQRSNVQAVQNRNLQVVQSGNVQAVQNRNVHAVPYSNVQAIQNRNVHELQNNNVQAVQNRNVHVVQNSNVQAVQPQQGQQQWSYHNVAKLAHNPYAQYTQHSAGFAQPPYLPNTYFRQNQMFPQRPNPQSDPTNASNKNIAQSNRQNTATNSKSQKVSLDKKYEQNTKIFHHSQNSLISSRTERPMKADTNAGQSRDKVNENSRYVKTEAMNTEVDNNDDKAEKEETTVLIGYEKIKG